MIDSKKQLSITLTEPVVFLRSSDPSGRHQLDADDSPALVRGIVNLNVVKPTDISSIEVELTGVLMLRPPEDIGFRRVDSQEKHKIYSSTVTVFRAAKDPHGGRPASVGPRLIIPDTNNDHAHAATTSSQTPSSAIRRSEGPSFASIIPDLGPSPPYTSVSQSPTTLHSRLGTTAESPAQTLEELRTALIENSGREDHQDRSVLPSPHSPSDASSASNDSLYRENDNYVNGTARTSPSVEDNTSLRSTSEELPHILPHSGRSSSRFSRARSPEYSYRTRFGTGANKRDPSHASTSRSRLGLSLSSVLDAVRVVTSRRASRSRDVPGSEEKERGRTRVRTLAEEHDGALALENVTGTWNDSPMRSNASHQNDHGERREHHLHDPDRVLGLEYHHEETDGEQKFKEHGSCREFKPGTYSYPISFLLPPNVPPTFSVPHASLNYVIKAVAHRPGTFTSKLSCLVPLLVVAAPETGTAEVGGDPGPLTVQQQWGERLVYSFGLSSRWFLLGSERYLKTAVNEGAHVNAVCLAEPEPDARAEAAYGTAVLDIDLLPLEKVKIWKLSVVVDQRVRYVDRRGELFRDNTRQVKLLEIEDACSAEELADEEEQTHKNKHKNNHDLIQIPLLPTPVSPHRSPLLQYIAPSADPSMLAGPGPYTLSASIGLPGCDDSFGSNRGLHFTMKHEDSSVKVEHSLRLVMRVERVGEESANDHDEGSKRRLFDIAVKSPITILSCFCVPKYHSLPKYSPITEDSFQQPIACACQRNIVEPAEQGQDVEASPEHVPTSSSRSSFDGGDGLRAGRAPHQTDDEPARRSGLSSQRHSRSPSRVRPTGHASFFGTTSLHLPHRRAHSPSSAPGPSQAHAWRRSSSTAHALPHSHSRSYSHDQSPYHHSGTQSYAVWTSHVRTHSQTPISTCPPSPLAQYERLVSGLESEAGDAPPSYESIASGH